ncbi:MAG: hypothetical protein HY059_09420 [Proteobacteria bacterium]|nr:hypothetical protein [Pseudomonadota bacterium]
MGPKAFAVSILIVGFPAPLEAGAASAPRGGPATASVRTEHFDILASHEGVAWFAAEIAERTFSRFAERWAAADVAVRERVGLSVTFSDRGDGGYGEVRFAPGRGGALTVSGTPSQIEDFLLPHEVQHALMRAALGRRPPLWFDEGAAIFAETDESRSDVRQVLRNLVRRRALIPMRQLLPGHHGRSPDALWAVYAQGYSLIEFLIERGGGETSSGRRTLLAFVKDGMRAGEWDRSLRIHYGIAGTGALDAQWRRWLEAGAL